MSRSRTTTLEAAHRAAFSGFGPDDLMVRLPTNRPPTHPGEMLREEYLPDFGWSAAELAERLRVPRSAVDALLAEEAPATPDLALRLGRLFGQTPAYWIKGQLAYDFYFALKAAASDLAAIVPVDAEPVAVDAEAEPLRKAG
ncbi:MAG TPA: HigA family addiction module antitoxin [Longimicrobium sp.]|nr:HigA family addiction module antitoxin [Longimicrobium sp.]